MFLKKPSGVGISLHAGQLEIACAQGRSLKSLNRMRYERISFPYDQYDNGRVHDVNQFAGKVNQLFETLKIPRRNVTIALPSTVAVLRPIMVPNIKKHKLREVIQFQIGKDIHLPFANPVFDFDFLPASFEVAKEGPDASSQQQGARESRNLKDEVPVLLVAAPGEVVHGLKHAFEQANVELSVVEVKGLSILRALKAIGRRPAGNLVILEFGMDRIEAHIYQKGALVFTRTLELVPGRYVASAVTAEMSLSEEETSPRTGRLDESDDANAWKLLERLELADQFEQMVMDLSYQVDRVMNFFQHTFYHSSEQPARNLWLTGQVPFPQRLIRSLTERLGAMNIQFVHLPSMLERKDDTEKLWPSLSVVGAAVKGMVSDAD